MRLLPRETTKPPLVYITYYIMQVNNNHGLSAVLKAIRDNLTVEQFVDLCHIIEKDMARCVENIVEGHVPIDRPEYMEYLNEDDLPNSKLGDYIDYLYTRGECPKKGLKKIVEILRKGILPVGGFITGDFESICFEQIPEHPIAKIKFSEKKNVTIKAKNNVIELQL